MLLMQKENVCLKELKTSDLINVFSALPWLESLPKQQSSAFQAHGSNTVKRFIEGFNRAN